MTTQEMEIIEQQLQDQEARHAEDEARADVDWAWWEEQTYLILADAAAGLARLARDGRAFPEDKRAYAKRFVKELALLVELQESQIAQVLIEESDW